MLETTIAYHTQTNADMGKVLLKTKYKARKQHSSLIKIGKMILP